MTDTEVLDWIASHQDYDIHWRWDMKTWCIHDEPLWHRNSSVLARSASLRQAVYWAATEPRKHTEWAL